MAEDLSGNLKICSCFIYLYIFFVLISLIGFFLVCFINAV